MSLPVTLGVTEICAPARAVPAIWSAVIVGPIVSSVENVTLSGVASALPAVSVTPVSVAV